MLHISLFSGIGGFDLASEWMGWKNIASCEINDFGNKILEHYWPESYHHRDIHTFTYDTINHELSKRFGPQWRSEDIILTGGFPCQPYSTAGKRLGKADSRHLWPEMLRTIREIQPRWILGENVRGLISWNEGMVFDEVQSDLEAEGYSVLPFVLPACAVNAPHRRDRVWFVALRIGAGFQAQRAEQQAARIEQYGKLGGDAADTDSNGVQGFSTYSGTSQNVRQGRQGFEKVRHDRYASGWEGFPTVPPICDGNDGISKRLDGITFSKWRQESIKAGGNAVVPQVVLQIFKAIEEYNNQ